MRWCNTVTSKQAFPLRLPTPGARAPAIQWLATLLAVFLLQPLAGQQRQPLRPVDLVEHHKAQGQAFIRADLLVPATRKMQLPGLEERKITAYTIFELNEPVVQQLLSDRPEGLTFTLPAGRHGPAAQVELVRVEVFSSGLNVFDSTADGPVEMKPGLHYRGTIKDIPGSLAAISIFDDEVMGFFTGPEAGNLILGKLTENPLPGGHILYEDTGVLSQLEDFSCETPDDGKGYSNGELNTPVDLSDNEDCIRLFLEVDHDVFLDKGNLDETTEYITGLFNQAATLYANEHIKVVLSELFIWTSPSPYTGTNSSAMLSQFQQQHSSFDGDLAQLVSYRASGGVAAGFSGLCNPVSTASMSFASIRKSYEQVPVYSFSVMVVAHELGHLFGSRHTHACVWNGNNTAIDGCAGYSEGDCATAGLPADGGTLMSYCHITSVGINFAKGFGPQPATIIRGSVANATCLQACQDDGGQDGDDDPADCAFTEVQLSITLDAYGSETSWELRSSDGTVRFSGGPYPDSKADSVVTEAFCLEDDCYTFEIFDVYGDGLCCGYGQGAYRLEDEHGNLLAEGGAFTFGEARDLCLPFVAKDDSDKDDGPAGPGDDSSCTEYEVDLLLYFDSYPGETSWQIIDAGGNILHQGGPYASIAPGDELAETFCLPEGCYDLVVEDSFGDGLCCRYGNGSYRLRSGDISLVEGAQFGTRESTRFCLPNVVEEEEEEGSEAESPCQLIDPQAVTIRPYGGGQDRGFLELVDNGSTIKLYRNAWKAIYIDYTVSPNTMLAFDFRSTSEGEVHGIGFDQDDLIAADYTFRLFGTQNWGISTFANYPGDGSWQHYVIPVGQYYTGTFDRLFLTADHDYGDHSGDAFFRNIRIYEAGSCDPSDPGPASLYRQLPPVTTRTTAVKPDFTLFPNPAGDYVNLRFFTKSGGRIEVQLYNIMGQRMKTESFESDAGQQEQRLQVAELPPGTYLLRFVSESLKGTKKLTIRGR